MKLISVAKGVHYERSNRKGIPARIREDSETK